MVFLVGIRAEKSVAEKSVLDSLDSGSAAALFIVCCLLAAVVLQFINIRHLCKALINVTIYSCGNSVEIENKSWANYRFL